MLAAFGFTVTGILFLLFALSLPSIHKKDDKTTEPYIWAYMLLSLAFLGYGVASLTGDTDALSTSMIIGNVLMFLATILILGIMFEQNKYRKQILYLAALIAIVLLAIRLVYFYPEPYMRDSILVFNSQRFVSFLLSAVFLLIWLPVNMRVAHMITKPKLLQSLDRMYIMLYTTATLSAVIFLLAKEPLALALSFAALSISFLMLVISNLSIKKIGAKHG